MSAAYLNLINDIWVVYKQYNSVEDFNYSDYKGKTHKVKFFNPMDDLEKAIIEKEIEHVYLDLDIDFFTIENSTSNDQKCFSYVGKEEMISNFSIDSCLMKWIFNRLMGITIALEPECTGSLRKSCELLTVLERLWFTHSIGNEKIEWQVIIKDTLQ